MPRPIRWFTFLLALLLWLGLAGTLVVWLGAGHSCFLELFTHFQLQYALGFTTLLVLFGLAKLTSRPFSRRDLLTLTAGVAVAGSAAVQVLGWTPAGWRQFPEAPRPGDPDLGRVRLLLANVHVFNSDQHLLLDLVRQEDPDIVLLAEIGWQWQVSLEQLDERYPVHLARHDLGVLSLGLWSRLSQESGGWGEFDEDSPHLDFVFSLPSHSGQATQRFRLLGLHPLPPTGSDLAARRNRVLTGAAKELAETTNSLPVIVAGDLNCTRYSPVFQELCAAGALCDAGLGSGAWRTWPIGGGLDTLLGIRIDHVLFSPHWRLVRYRAGPEIGSDHLPVLVELQLAEPTAP